MRPSKQRRKAARAQERIEAKANGRQRIWRERQPRRSGGRPDPVLPEDELLARDTTRGLRTARLGREIQRLYVTGASDGTT